MNIYTDSPGEIRRLPRSSEITLNHGYENLGFRANNLDQLSDSCNESNYSNAATDQKPLKKISEITATSLSSAYHNPFSHHVYEDIRFNDDESVASSLPGSPMTTRSHSIKSRSSAHGTFTRQLNLFIGEEWENVQHHHHHTEFPRKAFSCPSSPKFKKTLTITKQPEVLKEDYPCESSSTESTHQSLDHMKIFLDNMDLAPIPKECALKPNPHNKINHMFHSALHCPCYLFFCFLCCLPGVHYMLKGDKHFKRGNEDKAITYGKRATIFYITGTIFGILLLGGAVFFAVRFVQDQVG